MRRTIILAIILAATAATAREATRYESYVETRADRVSSAVRLNAYLGPDGITCDGHDKDVCARGCQQRQPDNARYLVDAECSWECRVTMVPAWPAPIPIMQCQRSCRCLFFGTEALMRLK